MIFLPVVQMSAVESFQAESKAPALSSPHIKLPAQFESSSQSPSPKAHGNVSVQQPLSSLLASQPEVKEI